MSQSPTPIRRGADARDTEAFAKQIAANLLTQNDAPQPVSPVPETKKPLIEMHGIRKSYYIGKPNELEILHGIDLTVYPGEFVAIVGESGSGKSTLMNIIGVLDKPTSGEYTLDGVNIHDAKDNQLADIRNRKIGFVFQTYNLIGRQSALKNVELPMLYAGVPGGERTRRAKEWLERVGMGERMKHQPNELSGGQKQRVAIAGVIAMRPDCLVLDEATAMLDPHGRSQVMRTIHQLREAGISIVSITHYMEEAAQADRVLVMSRGRIVMEGTPEEVFSQTQRLHSYHLDVPQAAELRDELVKIGIPMPENVITPDRCAEELYKLLQ